MKKGCAFRLSMDAIRVRSRSIIFLLLAAVVCSSSGDGAAIDVTFQVDLTRANEDHAYVVGQPLFVRCGYDSTAAKEYDIPMQRIGFTFTYRGSGTVDAAIGDTLFYRYVTQFGEEEQEEHYFDYNDASPFLSPKFKRKLALSGNEVSIEDVEGSIVTSHRMPVFPNVNMLSQSMLVTWECDMRPAYYALSDGKQFVNKAIEFPIDPITDPGSLDSLGVFINGTPTGMWQHWHVSYLQYFRLFDDGANGDAVAGDSIYTIRLGYPGGHPSFLISHYFKMGINGGDNEGGSGAQHMVNLDDSQPAQTVRFAWGEVDPTFYSEWDYDNNHMTSVTHHCPAAVPAAFYLHQNYPNPFNSTTTIHFDLAQEAYISVKVFNLLGQEVETLINHQLTAGRHHLQWTAPSALPTGLYWCELRAGERRNLIQLVLLK